ncbi:MAG: adenylate/guanylate cyclase domain-containing protein [Elusimicrobia bacterium]|jgi:adenylate cyclase|nr:adenylate/guanylate cyclase domain-containing protein [Elusimicrobiota bacterium]
MKDYRELIRKNRAVILMSAGITLFVIMLNFMGFGVSLNHKITDQMFRIRGPRPASDKVFIVAIGDESVSSQALGKWPWRRPYIASFISWANIYNPNSIILDILFTEPSEDFPNDDNLLAGEAEKSAKTFFPFFGIPKTAQESRGYSEKLTPAGKQLLENISLGRASDYPDIEFIDTKYLVMPIPKFINTTAGSGYVNAIPDSDGITRRIPLLIKHQDYLIPNIAFSGVIDYYGLTAGDIEIKNRNIILNTKDRVIEIPVDGKYQMLINHRGKFEADNINMVSFVGLVDSHFAIEDGLKPGYDLNKLKDSIVFLGLTATGTSDLRPTPFTPLFPMVGVLATGASNISEGNFLKSSPAGLNFVLIFLSGLLALLITAKFKAISSAVLNIVFLFIYFAGSYILFNNNYVITTVYPLSAVLLIYVSITIYKFTKEEKQKTAIRGMFQRYVSSSVVDVLIEDPGKIKLGGERKRLTVFFSDIRGFTSMSENLSAEEVVGVLNEYLTEMIDIIFKYNGTLDKFMGDAVMAIWGAPADQKNHAELALRAAWDMREELTSLQERWEREGKKSIAVGMGINTGDVVVGNMGSDQFADYTVIGDNVNLAARLEQNAGPGQLIISEATYEEVKDIARVNKLAPMKVKGKEKALSVYEVTGLKSKNERG